MKIAFLLIAVAVIAGSVFADYKWRHWISARRRDRNDQDPSAGR